MKKLILIAVAVCIVACTNKEGNSIPTKNLTEKVDSAENYSIIYLLPFEDVSKKEVINLQKSLEEHFDKLLSGRRAFKILNNDSLPKSAYIKRRNRYRSFLILDYESSKLSGKETIIGLTHKDICTDVHGKKDYGIIGISRPKKQVCVVSDKRLSNKADFWKPILHEYIHTYYGAKHCANDDDHCIMQDAKGKGNFRIKDKLCSACNH